MHNHDLHKILTGFSQLQVKGRRGLVPANFIEEIVREGTTDVDTVQKILKSQISMELKDFPPDALDRAFNPNRDDITNHIHLAIKAIELSKCDQENLQKRLKKKNLSLQGNSTFVHS